MDEIFKIEKIGHIIRISNSSEFCMIISLVPIKPKRKYIDIRIVKPGEFVIFDDLDYRIELKDLSFRFEERK